MDVGRAEAPPVWPVLIAPLLVVGGIVLLWISNELVVIGPFDRATFGWAVPIPMILVAPAVAGLAARLTGDATARTVLVGLAVGLGAFIDLWLTIVVDRIGCNPVSDKAGVLAYVAPIGIVAGLGFFLAGRVARRRRERPVAAFFVATAVAIAAGVATLMTFAAEFQGVTCVPVPSPG